MSDPAEPFETWLLRRVAHAVAAGDVSADLLTDLHAEIADARDRSPDDRHALALQELAERVDPKEGIVADQDTLRVPALQRDPEEPEVFLGCGARAARAACRDGVALFPAKSEGESSVRIRLDG